MTGRVSPQDVVAALYRTVDDDRLPWLDGLLIAAGFMRRCPCGLPAPADQRCDQRGRDEPDVVGVFDVCRGEAEATFTIGPLFEGDPLLRIGIAAAGGGAACPDNDWIYEVHLAGTLVCSGAGLRSGGMARTHRQMAAVLAEHLADTDQVPALRRHRARLALWAHAAVTCPTDEGNHS